MQLTTSLYTTAHLPDLLIRRKQPGLYNSLSHADRIVPLILRFMRMTIKPHCPLISMFHADDD
jgi:hypothetical protein